MNDFSIRKRRNPENAENQMGRRPSQFLVTTSWDLNFEFPGKVAQNTIKKTNQNGPLGIRCSTNGTWATLSGGAGSKIKKTTDSQTKTNKGQAPKAVKNKTKKGNSLQPIAKKFPQDLQPPLT